MKLDEETCKLSQFLTAAAIKQVTQKVTLFFIAQTRYLFMQNKIPTQLPNAILIAAGQAWATDRHQWRTCEGSFLLKTTLKATTVEGLCA